MGSMSESMAGGATRAGSPRPFLECEEKSEKHLTAPDRT